MFHFKKWLFVLGVCLTANIHAQLSVKASVEHAVPDGIDTDGSIRLTVTGGQAPYTYNWNSGTYTTKDIINVAKGSYTVVVTDAASLTKTLSYNIGSKVAWNDTIGTFSRNDTLLQTKATTGNQFMLEYSGVSKNSLPAGTDGWIEYVFTPATGLKVLGFLSGIGVYNHTDIEYGISINNGGVSALRSGTITSLGTPGTCVLGDVLRLERTGTNFRILKNGTVVYTFALSSTPLWRVKANFQNQYSNFFEYVGVSFNGLTNTSFTNYVRLYPIVVHSSGPGATDGSISLTPRPGVSGDTRSYLWTGSGSTSGNITGLSKAEYTVAATDQDNNSSTLKYNVGYKVQWTNFFNCSVTNDVLTSVTVSSANSSSNDFYAVSKNTLATGTDGWVEYIAGNDKVRRFLGFCTNVTGPGAIDISYGLQFAVNRFYLYKKGIINSQTSNWDFYVGDLIRIERVGNAFRILKNGGLIYTETIAAADLTSPWKLKANFANILSSSFERVGCSFDGTSNVSFPNFILVKPGLLGANTATSNDAMASVTPIASGSYSYLWTGGATTSSITAKPRGAYQVTVSDANNNSSTYAYTLGYRLHWDKFYGTQEVNDQLTQTLVTADHSEKHYYKAVSKNTLPANTDGWFEIVWDTHPGRKALGFTDSILEDNYYDIYWGLYFQSNVVRYIENGVRSSSVAQSWLVQPGDVLRMERIGNTINVIKNGAVLLTQTVPAWHMNKNWKVKANFQDASTNSFDWINCSFDGKSNSSFPRYVQAIPSTVHASQAGTTDGSVNLLSPRYSSTAQTYNWTTSSTTGTSLSNIPAGAYPVTLTDVDNNTSVFNYEVGYKPEWGNFTGCLSRNDSLLQTTTIAGVPYQHDLSAVAKNLLPLGVDGWAEYMISGYSESRTLGFVNNLTAVNYSDVVYGIMIQGSNVIHLIKNGVMVSSALYDQHYYYQTGDVFRIARVGSEFMLFKNGGLIFRETIASTALTQAWRVKATFYNPIKNYFERVGLSFAAPTTSVTSQTSYAGLSSQLGSGYFDLSSGQLNFTMQSNVPSTTLQYKVFNASNTLIYSNAGTPANINTNAVLLGNNYYTIDFSASALASGYYVLEVTDAYNVKSYLRFRQP